MMKRHVIQFAAALAEVVFALHASAGPATLSLSANGKVIGSVTAPAGARVHIVGFTGEAVGMRVGNIAGQVPIDATNPGEPAKAEQEIN